jgi:hypothetical protein
MRTLSRFLPVVSCALLSAASAYAAQWTLLFGPPPGYLSSTTSAQPTSDGGYVVAGFKSSYGMSGGDAWVLKLDANGNILWQKAYAGGGDDYDRASAIQVTADGGYVVAGSTSSPAGVSDAWVLKLDGRRQRPLAKELRRRTR